MIGVLKNDDLFIYNVKAEDFVPEDHPLRRIREVTQRVTPLPSPFQFLRLTAGALASRTSICEYCFPVGARFRVALIISKTESLVFSAQMQRRVSKSPSAELNRSSFMFA